MIDRGLLTRHVPGLAALFAWAFLVLSLVGYDPADPPGASVYDPRRDPVSGSFAAAGTATANPCGPVGAALAHGLLQTIGWASALLVYALATGLWLHWRRRRVPDVGLRVLGVALVLLIASALIAAVEAHRGAPLLDRCPPVGGGGMLGAVSATMLANHFGPVGMGLILAAAGLAGLALGRDLLVSWPLQELRRALGRNRQAYDGWSGVPAVPATLPPAPYAIPVERLVPPSPRFAGDHETRPILNRPPDPAPPRPPSIAAPGAPGGGFALPPIELLEPPASFPVQEHEAKIHARAMLLEKTLLEFGCVVRVVQIDTGPVITQFEIELEAGLRVAKINSVANDLAIALAVPSVRIVSPIPGKTTVGIEVPNDRRATVKLGDVYQGLAARAGAMRIPLFLGKDVKGQALAYDLAEMPHLLIAGRTGTGKSVCLNAMIMSILMTKRPDEVKLLLIDPKMVELSQFKRVPHLMHPVITDMKKAESVLAWACDKMDERYGFLQRAGVRNIQSYNALGPDEIFERLRPEDEEEQARIPTYMPYIVIIADEMADLMMTAAKEVESHIVRLAQKSRAVGMHLIVATQKPTVDVITGLIKGNLPARIAFQVASRGDSRVVLDEMGADKLLGNGDMLFLVPGTSHILRAQGTYVSDGEVNRVTQFLERYPVEFSKELVGLKAGAVGGKDRSEALKQRDELYEPAIEIIIREGRGSCSLLQRALGIGYGRAARLIDFMAEDGIVGEYKSGSAREVLYSWEEWESLKGGGEPGASAA